MKRVQTMVQLTDALVAQLDREASRRNRSRSALIREVLEAWLSESDSERIGRAIAEGYRRIPQDTPDDWGNVAEIADIATVELAQKLDEEERRAGFGPWQ